MIIFKTSDFPRRVTDDSSFSLYRGVLVQWDEDRDARVLGVIDAMPARVVDRLRVVCTRQDFIRFVWEGYVPGGYEAGRYVALPDGDCWLIGSSTALPQAWRCSHCGYECVVAQALVCPKCGHRRPHGADIKVPA